MNSARPGLSLRATAAACLPAAAFLPARASLAVPALVAEALASHPALRVQQAQVQAAGAGVAAGFSIDATGSDDDVLDFSSFALTGSNGGVEGASNITDFTKGSAPSKADFDAGDFEIVVFRSGASETAQTIEAEFNVSTASDYVKSGSVNDLLDAGESMIFGIRTTDDQTGGDMFNFWLWVDAGGASADGSVQASELTLLASLVELSQASSFAADNLRYVPPVLP